MRIASRLTQADGAAARLTAKVHSRYAALPGGGDGHHAALRELWAVAHHEPSTLAYADAFRTIMVAFLLATLVVPLLRRVGAPKPAVAAAEH